MAEAGCDRRKLIVVDEIPNHLLCVVLAHPELISDDAREIVTVLCFLLLGVVFGGAFATFIPCLEAATYELHKETPGLRLEKLRTHLDWFAQAHGQL